MRIAVLQPDPDMRLSIEQIILGAHHSCVAYDDGLAMSKALARSTVDLLILDWHGARLSGVEVLRSLRGVGGERLPVMFASRDTSEASMVRAFVNGADDYVGLPLRAGEFRERIAALLRRAYPDRFNATSFTAGPYHFDISRRPQSLAQQRLFNKCSRFVHNPAGAASKIPIETSELNGGLSVLMYLASRRAISLAGQAIIKTESNSILRRARC
jgi:DNA-binding response OmpR family regulator